jgi:hypothetical protein
VIDIDQEDVMARLLTGSLSRGEREAVEARLAADPAYFEAVCAFEDEMIRDWHRGELAAEARRAIADTYLGLSARRARVESGRLLIDTLEDWKHAHESRAPWWLAAAAALVLALLPVALYVMRDGVRPAADSVVFQLAPVAERGSDGASHVNELRIPRDAADVRLQFEISDPGGGARVDAILESLERAMPAATYPALLERAASLVRITVTLPSDKLHDGDYVIRLRRARSDALLDIIATRTFRIVRE